MSIDKKILYFLIKDLVISQEKSHDWKKEVLWLSKVVVFHDPTKNYQLKGDSSLLDLIPSRKSLFGGNPNKGLPIGNYSSQFFANLYLNVLDHFVKRKIGCRKYVCYVDDFVILSRKKLKLRKTIPLINVFLKKHLKLELNFSKTKLRSLREGISFLGYFVKPGYTLIKKDVVRRFEMKLSQLVSSKHSSSRIL
jgi:hypothetical protein